MCAQVNEFPVPISGHFCSKNVFSDLTGIQVYAYVLTDNGNAFQLMYPEHRFDYWRPVTAHSSQDFEHSQILVLGNINNFKMYLCRWRF
jgi:hypothetical protein